MSGLLWLGWNMAHHTLNNTSARVDVCLFHRVTGLPCPSCGTTRSMMYLANMQAGDAIRTNPIGLLLALAIIILPVWVLYDLLQRKNSFYRSYDSFERLLRKRWVALTFIVLIAANWAWNIYKFT